MTAPIGFAALKRSFPPIADARARVLVLGTLPGEASLRRGEYYAHPRNLFWPIVFGLFNAAPVADYAGKVAFVKARRIAVWDVCEIGEREASADSTIRREQPNAIDQLLDAHPLIRAVASTAPAHSASMTATSRGTPASLTSRCPRPARHTPAWTTPASSCGGWRCARPSRKLEPMRRGDLLRP